MDKTGAREKLENELAMIDQYLSHPISREIFDDNKEKQEEIVELLTKTSIIDLSTLFRHVEAVGVLRGLRQSKAIVEGDVQVIKTKLEEL